MIIGIQEGSNHNYHSPHLFHPFLIYTRENKSRIHNITTAEPKEMRHGEHSPERSNNK